MKRKLQKLFVLGLAVTTVVSTVLPVSAADFTPEIQAETEMVKEQVPQPVGPAKLQASATWNGSGDVVLTLDTSEAGDVAVYAFQAFMKPGDVVGDSVYFGGNSAVDLGKGIVTITENDMKTAIQTVEDNVKNQTGKDYKFTRGTVDVSLMLVDRSNLDETGNVINWDLFYRGILNSEITVDLGQEPIDLPTLQKSADWNGSGDVALTLDGGGLTEPVVDTYTASIIREGDMQWLEFNVDRGAFDFGAGKVILTETEIQDAIALWKSENNNEKFTTGNISLTATITEKANLDETGNVIDSSKVYSLYSGIGINTAPAPEVVSMVWNGKQDIEIMIPEELSKVGVVGILGLKGGSSVGYLNINNVKQEVVANKLVLKGEDLKNATYGREELPVDWEKVDKLEILVKYTFENQEMSKRLYVSVDLGTKPQLVSGTWTGENDIEIKLPEGATEVFLGEAYGHREGVSIAGPKIEASVQGDKLVIKNHNLKNAVDIMAEGQLMDWTKIDKLEVVILYKLGEKEKINSLFVPVNYKETKPEKPEVVLTDKSGVTMEIPASAPSNLTLKVEETNSKAEKEVISKLVQINGNNIKTFDLSLWKDGKEWKYDGQFKSRVTLPVPEGWNLDLLGLYYFDETANKASTVPFTVNKANRTITFETDHFSKFVLVERAAGQGESTSDTPKTGDQANTAVYMMLVLAAGAVVVISMRKRRA